MITPADVERIVGEYSAGRLRYMQFTDSLVNLLRTLLNAEKLVYVSATGRAKDVDSFRDKITREGKSYGDPMAEVTDLCGARVVCYDSATVHKIGQVIAKNFAIDTQNSVDKSEQLDLDQFGYRSIHFVVGLDERRRELPEYKMFADMKAEIQVRTALQHAWAELDHSLRYKAESDVPKELRRRLYRISALLELADDEFLRLKEQSDQVRSEYAADVNAGKLESIGVDSDSIDEFIEKNPARIQVLNRAADQAGFALSPSPPNQKTPWTNLVRTLDAAGVRNLLGFDDALARFSGKAQEVLMALATRWGIETEFPRLVLDPSTLLRLAVIFSLPNDKAIAAMSAVRFGPSLQSVMEHELAERASAAGS